MLVVEIEKEFYELPEKWSDITLEDFIEIVKLAENVPDEDAVEAEKFGFYLEFVSLFGIPKDLLRSVKLYDAESGQMGLINLFNHLWQFSQMPEIEFEKFSRFPLAGKMYCFNDKSVDLIGNKKPMAEYTFQEYEEANSILVAMTAVKENQLEHLATLSAIFYRPAKKKAFQWLRSYEAEAYDEATVKDRAELFKGQLGMDKILKAYFFLLKRIAISNVDTANSLMGAVAESLRT